MLSCFFRNVNACMCIPHATPGVHPHMHFDAAAQELVSLPLRHRPLPPKGPPISADFPPMFTDSGLGHTADRTNLAPVVDVSGKM